MTKPPALKRLIELQELLLVFQTIERFVRSPLDHKRENDVEHSYHLAMAAWFLAPHFGLDRDRAIRVALAHDLVEIYAGDTFAFGKQDHLDSKIDREHEALDKLKQDWQDFPEMGVAIEEYKEKTSEEAKFVYALDKIMPAILNHLNGGLTWRQHKVTMTDFRAEKERKIPKDSPLFPFYQDLLTMLQKTPEAFHRPDEGPNAH